MKRIDERDIMFSRMGYSPGSKEYLDYYNRNPGKEQIDEELRNMPHLCAENTPTYDSLLAPVVEANFALLSDLRKYCEGRPSEDKASANADEITKLLKTLTLHYGALDVGIARADENDYYSHRGRHRQNYGKAVDTSGKFAIVFMVDMNKRAVNTAPAMPTAVETSKAYVNAAMIGLQIAYYIRSLGYDARCHMDGNYLMPAVPIAAAAGLGEVGRNGLLISRKNGCFVRLGIVTTDLELIYDSKADLDIKRFCRLCGMCVKTCPGRTISDSPDCTKWKIEQEKCYKIWRGLGTDCGICISTCPIGQGISAEKIKGMSDSEISGFIDDYKDRYGSRKRNAEKYFK